MTYPNKANVYDEMRIEVMVTLATLGEPFIPNLINALADIDSMVLCGAAQVLVRLGQGAAPWLMDALEQHPRYQVRARVAQIFGWFAADDPVRALASQFKVVRGPTPPGLGIVLRKVLKEVVPSLIKALKDENWIVRFWAVRALSGAGADAAMAVPDLLEFLREAEAEDGVRNHVPNILYALAHVGCNNPDLIPLFVKRLEAPCPDTLMAAGTAFFEIGPTGVVTVLPALEVFLTKVEASMRKSAEIAMSLNNGKPQVKKASKRTDTNNTGPQTGV